MLTTLAFLAVLAAPIPVHDTVRVDVGRASRVWIEGGSNVHNWSCTAAAFDARVDIAQADSQYVTAIVIRRVSVKLSARDLKCGNRKMDHDLYEALKASDPANPSFVIAVFDAEPGTAVAGTVDTRGTLQVAGVERAVTTRIATERLADGTVRATGSVPLRMTDFGVKPPIGLFGLIRAKNDVVVKFDLVITPRP